MTNKELLEKSAHRFRIIADDTNRITSGNLSHNLTCLRGFALRAAESIERHLQEQEEPVNEDLNTAAKEYANNITKKIGYRLQLRRAVCFGANWQKEKMMKEAIDGIARPDDSEIWCNLSSFNLKDGDKVRVVVIKED